MLELARDRPVLDVRSPGEFENGHIPGAISFPLFSNEERAEVGTIYKKIGQEKALEVGLRIVGPKMESMVKEAKKLAPERKLIVHCWRGGQRSLSVAWLLNQAGFEVNTLAGGYKAYRNFVLNNFAETPFKIVILGGKTGSGKTRILHALQNEGEQIIDLEGIAHHKGSAFGFIGESEQTTFEQFENNLFEAVRKIDIQKRVWVENESHSIGRVYIPDGFWQKMKKAPLVNIQIPENERVQNLLDDYLLTDKSMLEIAFKKIEKKLGGQNLKLALQALDEKDYAGAARIALTYYDKTYQHGLNTNMSPHITQVKFNHRNPVDIARELSALDIS